MPNSFTLFLKLNYFVFFVNKSDEQNNYRILYRLDVPLDGLENNRISNLEKVTTQ